MLNVLYLQEEDVVRHLPMARAIAVLRDAALSRAQGRATNEPRLRVAAAQRMLHILPAGSDALERLGVKTYLSGGARTSFWYLLFHGDGLEAIIEADMLGRIRTGAASGVATDLLARPDATRLAVIGSGSQARTQIAAVAQVRRLTELRLSTRDPQRRASFVEEMQALYDFPVIACSSAEEAVRDADIVTTITTAKEPLFAGQLLAPGTHVNAVGSNRATHREIDDTVIQRSSCIVVEDIAQAHKEAGDLLRCAQFDWARVAELGELLLHPSTPASQSQTDLTLFESLGIGLWDLAVATEVVAQVRAESGN